MEGVLLHAAKSHRKAVVIPSESPWLAELLGIVFGDGGINNPWQVVVTLSALKDQLYAKFVSALFTQLFGISIVVRKQTRDNTLRLVCSSTNVVDFLVSKGAVRGNKIRQQIVAPLWINQDPAYQAAFVRGLVDTDGCLYIHKHVVGRKMHGNIGLCFTSYSKKLIGDVARILKSFGVVPHIVASKTRIYLYSAKAVKRYLGIFGTSNERISVVYENWLSDREN